MKTDSSLYAFVLFLLAITTSHAQTTVSAGAGYGNEVYFSLATGVVGSAPLQEWDIAVEVAPGYSASILTNGGKGVLLYAVPGKGIEDFGDWVDTTGMAAEWGDLYNSTVSWHQGAFNGDADYETGNFGWGEYNMVTHTVSGTTLYVLLLPDGSAKQVVIEGLANRTYTLQIADLDGENQRTVTIKKDDYPDRQFVYYSVNQDKVMDREPISTNWDLLFGKYIAFVGAGADIPYGVFGVRSAPGIRVAEVDGADPHTALPPNDSVAYSDAITTIGHDWKNFTGSNWELRSIAYFVQNREETIYRLVFTNFDGSATGTSTFELQEVSLSSVAIGGENVAEFTLYPNIIREGTLLSCVYLLEHSADHVNFHLFDLTGKQVQTEVLSSEPGFYEHRLHVNLPSGEYLGVLEVDGVSVARPVIVGE